MTATRAKWAATWLAAVAMTLLATRGHAGLGDLDVRFGSNGRLEIADPYDAQVLVQPDGKLLAVGNPSADDRRSLVLARWLADGRPDLGFGQGGRVVVVYPMIISAAALQPDGKIVLAGAAPFTDPATGANQWVRGVARIDADGQPDPSFGTDGFVNGGDPGPGGGFGPDYKGYSLLRVLPGGDILATIDVPGIHLIDRFGPDGRLLAATSVEGEVIDLAADLNGSAIVLSRRSYGGVVWRLLPNGEVDRRFGDQGYAEIRNTYALGIAADPGSRYLVCGSAGIQAYVPQGRPDTSFGSTGDGRVPFDEPSLPGASQCALAIVPSSGPLMSRGDVIVVAANGGLSRTAVARLDGNGRIDRSVGAGKGWLVVRTRRLPGTALSLQAVHDRVAENPVAIWQVADVTGVSSTVVQAVDMGHGSRRGAVGVTEHPTPFGEVTTEFLGVDSLIVVRSGPPTGAARVRYRVVPGTAGTVDVALPAGELLWAAGDGTSREILVPVINDDLLEGEETFQLQLFDAFGLELPQELATFTIVDDEALRALRFEKTSVNWPAGPSPPFSAWPEWVLHLDVSVPGPVTVFHLLSNGVDSCCLGRLRWAAGEHGMRSIASYPGEQSGLGEPAYFVFLYDGTWRELEQYARIEQVIPQPPTVTPPPPQTGGSPFNPTPKPASGNSGGGGAFDLAAVAAWLALLLVRCAGRRHAFLHDADPGCSVRSGRRTGWRTRGDGHRSLAQLACSRRTRWAAAALLAVAMTLLAPRAHAGLGDPDMSFGSNGRLEIADPYDAQVLVQADGKLLAVGSLRVARGIDRRYLVLSRWLADGQPDLGYGQGGRIVVPAPAWNEADIGAAALQPDGKIVIAGAGGVGVPATGANQWLRYVARIDANGQLDRGFGASGIVSGGEASPGIDGFGPGYTALRVLANGDLLAMIDDRGVRSIDRFAPDGRLVATTHDSEGGIIDFVADSDTTAIVLSRRDFGGVLWRLLPNGEVDPSFGDQGQVEIRDTNPGALAADPGSRIVVCNDWWIQAYDLRGRVDKSFGTLGDGRVRFDDQSPQRASGCLAVSMRAGGLNDFGAITIVAAELGNFSGSRFFVAQLDRTGRIDRDVGAGSGWQVIPVGPLPGDLRPMRALLDRETDNPLGVWKVTDASGGSRLLVRALDMGVGTSRGAAGVMELDRPFNERQKAHVLTVVRSGPWTRAARVRFQLLPGTAGSDDLELGSGDLLWPDGDGTAREIALTFRDDDLLEGEETFRLRLHDASGLDVSQEFTAFTIVDDDAVRALKFEQPSITWTTGPNIPTSAWPVWKLRLDEPVPGPVTAYYQLDDGLDWCCVGLVQWAAGERGTRTVAPFPGQLLGPVYFVRLLNESADPLEQFASVTVIAEPTPTPPSPPPPSGGSTLKPPSNPSGGGGAFDVAAAVALLALLLVRRLGRRHALR